MKFLGFNIGKRKADTVAVTQPSMLIDPNGNYDTFTSFLAPTKTGNLATPYIDKNYGSRSFVNFGIDNLYPQLIEELAMMSPANASIIGLKTNAIAGGGYFFENLPTNPNDKVDLMQFESTIKLNQLPKQYSRDLVKHGRMATELIFKVENGQKKLIKANRINPSKIRNGEPCENGFKSFTYCDNWKTGAKQIEIAAYHPTCTAERQLLVYQQDTGENGVYPIPTWLSAADWIFVDGELSYHHKSNIINAINPSFYLNFPKPANKQAKENLRETLRSAKGAKGNGTVFVFYSNNKDEMPQIGTIQTSNNDKLFLQTSKEAKENICYAHEIDKAILGISQAGSLSNIQQLQTSYNFFEKNVVLPMRSEVQAYLNEILSIKGITAKLVINQYQLVDGEIVKLNNNNR